MAVEQTLSIIKPDAVAKNLIGEIYHALRARGSEDRRCAHDAALAGRAEGFYAVHKGGPSSRISSTT